jgi:hypothetical protein
MEVAASSDIGLTVVFNLVETLSRFHRIRYVWQGVCIVRTRARHDLYGLKFAAKRRYYCRKWRAAPFDRLEIGKIQIGHVQIDHVEYPAERDGHDLICPGSLLREPSGG